MAALRNCAIGLLHRLHITTIAALCRLESQVVV
jgi:hypothetical protein